MEPLPTYQFLAKKLGLVNGNPFSDTQAEEEERLSKYFVDLPAFYKILDIDTGKPKSSILSASRGCGKSANRRNVERWLKQGPKQEYSGEWPWTSPVLIVRYTDFTRLKTLVNNDFSKTRPEDHINSILWISVASLIEYLNENWGKRRAFKINDRIISQLGYFLINYSSRWAYIKGQTTTKHSSPLSLNQNLDSFLEAACALGLKANHLENGGSTTLLQGFKEIAFTFGINDIAILVDGIDELELTANDPKLSAIVLKPLISERALMQLDGVYFKFFLPNEVVAELKQMPETRLGERIKSYEMSWDENSIQLLLSERLKVFSNGSLHDLAQIATPDLVNIGQILASYAHNNPRYLLRLCEWILIYLEDAAKKEQRDSRRATRPRISPSVLENAINSFQGDTIHKTAYAITKDNKETTQPLLSINGWEITHDLQVKYLGKSLSSEKLDPKEYQILNYFLLHPEQLIRREEIGQIVWKEKWVSKYGWVLNQAILRLRKKIGQRRIETVRGMGYIFHIK